ncbi:hypothetical protein Dacet_1722 [Denitrovibrio acetiphilus DSM 12809]|uniref:Lipocalin-like domain-containing protein n=1 Tax=Denitrovibrio acetiphilus (strain DSM 12809 / NBRC 114555 / N2460) TaxID=522772 RepID=D4H0H3_DENA2|nr:VCBS domain-containing protein [Denitrovibrio acetiphilus]ADD68486.1 hypothetical protein Dacet_1722 [Denitrovibrio acetiphilus DSM 12809]
MRNIFLLIVLCMSVFLISCGGDDDYLAGDHADNDSDDIVTGLKVDMVVCSGSLQGDKTGTFSFEIENDAYEYTTTNAGYSKVESGSFGYTDGKYSFVYDTEYVVITLSGNEDDVTIAGEWHNTDLDEHATFSGDCSEFTIAQ